MKNLFFGKGIEKANFIRVEDGWIFSPHGAIGKSYKVDEERMNLLSRHLRRYYGVATIFVVVSSIPLILTNLTEYWAWGFFVVALAGLLAWYRLTIRSALQGIEPTTQRPTRQARRDAMISTMSHGRINFTIAVGVVFLPLGVWTLWDKINEGPTSDLLFSLIFAGLGPAFIAWGTRYKRVKRRLDREGQVSPAG